VYHLFERWLMFFNETYSDFVEVLRAWTNIIGIYLFEFNSENFPLAKYIRETKIVPAHRADCSNAANWISPAVA
jgi:hypothetical protein